MEIHYLRLNKEYYLKLLKLVICFIISGLCLLFIFRKVDFYEVIHIFYQLNYFWFFIATIVGIFKMWLMGSRFRCLDISYNVISSKNSFYFYTIGTMVNMILPFRAGDIVRGRLLAESLKIKNAKVLGAIATEHIIDFMVLCCLLISCIGFYSYHWPTQVVQMVMTFFLIAIGFLSIIIILKLTSRLYNLWSYVNHLFPKQLIFLSHVITNFYLGLFRLGSFFNILKMVIITASIWLAQGIWIYALFCSLGIAGSYHLGFEAVLVLVVMMGLAVMLPASPGYIGTLHLMIVLGLTQLGVTKSVALSYAILAHAHALGWAIIVGLYSLWQSNLKLSFNLNRVDQSILVNKEAA